MTTPMMQQWQECKEAAGSAILLFRMGDFYEAFHDDAPLLAELLDVTLTKRQEIPMAGVPVHNIEQHIDRLISKGKRVAIAEQMEASSAAKGLVKREVVRVVTPGTATESVSLSESANNFIVGISFLASGFGLASLDLSTAHFQVCQLPTKQALIDELHRIHPSEIVIKDSFAQKLPGVIEEIKHSCEPLVSQIEDWRFETKVAEELLLEQFGVASLAGFGLKEKLAAISAAGALLHYVGDTLKHPLQHITTCQVYETGGYMAIDKVTQRNLELIRGVRNQGAKNTLLSVLDQTQTPMGARLLKQWICQPLLSTDLIQLRACAVEFFLHNEGARESIQQVFTHVRDMERLTMKVSYRSIGPRDLQALAFSLQQIPSIQKIIMDGKGCLPELAKELVDCTPICERVLHTLVDHPPVKCSDVDVIRKGVNADLDEYKALSLDSKSWIANYQETLRKELGIKTLKVGFNRMFGYYLEVSRKDAAAMPDSFIRRQTLVNNERYISPELKQYEEKILSAQDRIAALEQEEYQRLVHCVNEQVAQILACAKILATVDVLCSLAESAKKHHYCRPVVDDSNTIAIEKGRHPVLDAKGAFQPNSCFLDDQKERLQLITGPNMGGKSTYIRQTALLVLMAQIGSFVPADRARIGIVDCLFSRVGAGDDLAEGQSTFMVEMTESAHICNNATERSLVILDEIGRGTSTYDGISIAWAIAEHLLFRRARVLFATHYFELTKLEGLAEGAVNYHVTAEDMQGEVVFLRRVVRGAADRSYGIHVGRLAGLPKRVLARAESLLKGLESGSVKGKVSSRRRQKLQKTARESIQLSLFEPVHVE